MSEGAFFLVAVTAFGSWLLAIIESLGLLAFWSWVFALGPRVLREEPVPFAAVLHVGERFATKSAKFSVVSPSCCLFRHKFRLFGFNTPFPIKGRIDVGNSQAVAEGRIPLGPVIFIGLWLAGWTLGSWSLLLSADPATNNTGIPSHLFAALGFGAVAAMVGLSLPLELRRARRAVHEFTQHHAAA